MKSNVATWDRILRIFTGIPLTAWGVAGGPDWSFVGLVLLATGAWAYSPLYAFFRTGTLRSGSKSRLS